MPRFRPVLIAALALVAQALVTSAPASAAPLPVPGPSRCQYPPATENRIVPVTDNLYQFAHGQWLSTFIVTDAGIVLIDPLNAKAAAWFKDEAKKRFNKDVRYVINTHGHCDHAEGGQLYDKATVVAQENIVAEYQSEDVQARYPDITYRDHLTLNVGGELIELHHFGADHGNAMTYVLLPRLRTLVTVDLTANDRLPYKDLPYDDPQGTIDSLRKLEALDFDRLLPGHGNAGTKATLARERAYWELLRAAVTARIVEGQTLEQIKQAVPAQLADYSGWQMFKEWGPYNIEAMHRILTKQGVKAAK